LGTGLLIGFVCISILNLAQWISGTTAFSYNGFDWHLIPLIPLVFIQCSAEEMLLIYVLNKKGKLRETGKL